MPRIFEAAHKSMEKAFADLQAHLDKTEWDDYADRKLTKLRAETSSLITECNSVAVEVSKAAIVLNESVQKLRENEDKFRQFAEDIHRQQETLAKTNPDQAAIKKFEQDTNQKLKALEKEHKSLSKEVAKNTKTLDGLIEKSIKLNKKIDLKNAKIHSLVESKGKIPSRLNKLLITLDKLIKKVSIAVSDFVKKFFSWDQKQEKADESVFSRSQTARVAAHEDQHSLQRLKVQMWRNNIPRERWDEGIKVWHEGRKKDGIPQRTSLSGKSSDPSSSHRSGQHPTSSGASTPRSESSSSSRATRSAREQVSVGRGSRSTVSVQVVEPTPPRSSGDIPRPK